MSTCPGTDSLLGLPKQDYGADYRGHLLSQYKLYVDSAHQVTAWRGRANVFFISVNMALLSLLGLAPRGLIENAGQSGKHLPIVPAAGVLACCCWLAIIKSYRQLNTGKFKVIHRIERMLPLRLFDAEWDELGRGKDPKRYRQLTIVESWVPRLLIGVYTLSLALGFRSLVLLLTR